MIKRLLIAGILVALFLGGVGYFNLVFKPAMIKEFVGKMAPPAATVTAERAGTKEWVDRVKSIGTLMAIQGIDVAPEVAGIVKEYYFESGNDVPAGAKLVALDTSVEEADLARNRAILLEANADLKRQAEREKWQAERLRPYLDRVRRLREIARRHEHSTSITERQLHDVSAWIVRQWDETK